MKIALIPWAERFMHDKIFDLEDTAINIDHRNDPYKDMQQEFVRRGDEFHTIDHYENLAEVDYFLLFEMHLEWLKKLTALKLNHKLIYCNAEPPTVNKMNTAEGYRKITRWIPYVMTWNQELVDEKTVFSRNIPYYFKENIGNIPYEKRKLLTSISGNKKSNYPGELYSERERVITFFEQNYPEEFDFYGTGWNGTEHPAYKGKVDVKAETFHKYRFALAFENSRGLSGYVTEKILDCLTSGIVPVYAGAEDILDYIPQDCFIPYDKFKTYQELADYLFSITETEYEVYLTAAQRFLHSDAVQQFSGKRYAEDIYYLIEKADKQGFQVTLMDKIKLNLKVWKIRSVAGLKNAIRKILMKE